MGGKLTKERRQELYRLNRERCLEVAKASRKRNADKIRERDRLRGQTNARQRYNKNRQLQDNYGISIEQFEAMLAAQHGQCPICSVELTTDGKAATSACVDHSHLDGSIRKLLCSNCNAGIGLLQDSPAVLLKAIQYLNNHENRHTE